MHKTLAIFSGVLAAVSILASGARADPRNDDRGGRDPGFRGAAPQAYRGGAPPAYGGGAPRPPSQGYRSPQGGGYPGEYRYGPAPAPAYPEGYAPPRRANSLGADWREQQEEARSGVRQGQMAPLGSVIQGIGRRSAGRPLDAGIEYQGSRAVYRVRWLMNNGRRVDYIVDAATGRVMSEH